MARFGASAALAVATAALAGVAQATQRDTFDCLMRETALEFAQSIQPFRPASSFAELADALNGTPEKAPNCTVTADREAGAGSKASRFRHAPLPSAGATVFVDPVNGNDSNNGAVTSPLRTIEAALALTRASSGGGNAIVLRAGTFYQRDTLVLGAQDSGLSIQSYPGEEAWLSGALPLTNVTWSPYNVTPGNVWTVAPGQNAVFAAQPTPGRILVNGTQPSWQACEAACQANNTAGGGCNVWTWHDNTVEPEYRLQCYFRLDGQWSLTAEPGHTSGHVTAGPNIWRASLAGTGVSSVPGLRWNGKRMIRARFPNADPETDGFMPPAVFRANWTAQVAPAVPDVQIDLSTPVRNTSVSMFQTFTAGIGGTCARFDPPAGYWCSKNVQGGGSVIFAVPIAMQVGVSTLLNMPYKNATGAIIQTWRPGHWASWMGEVGDWTFDNATGAANFSIAAGFFQGSRGASTGEDTFIENVFEELDAPGEWYYDPVTQYLYLWHNETHGAPPPVDGSIVITQIKHLVNITATQSSPATNISLLGLGFRDTAYTYMDPHGIPSGGDWTLERSAVVFLEGTEGVTVEGNVFERVDGNAVMLSAYNRYARITYNEFVWIGATCVAAWGNTYGGDSRLPAGYGLDGTTGDQPRLNYIAYNLAHEIGVWEKQSSFWHQAKSSENTVEANIVYNGPRAHVNFNDGFRGGARLVRNLLLNSCRESGDHGPFNSWDRDPYLVDFPDGSTNMSKMYDEIAHNFVIANYNSLGAVDNDDGSSYYYTHDNFFIYGNGGLKNDFEGHDNIHENNIYYGVEYALHNGYSGIVGSPGKAPYALPGHQPQSIGNIAIINKDGDYSKPVCNGTVTTILGNNTIISPTGAVTECGVSLSQWQADGNDLGSVAMPYDAVSDEQIIAWARQRLGL